MHSWSALDEGVPDIVLMKELEARPGNSRACMTGGREVQIKCSEICNVFQTSS